MSFKILFKFASRSRPEKCFAAIDNIHAMAMTDNWKVMLTLDADDPTMANSEVLEKINSYGEKVIHYYGFSDSKICAINRDIFLAPEWDILVVHADDMVIVEKGFDYWIVEDMQKNFPDTDGILHYLDGSPAKDKLITWPVIGKKYFERFNYIYHPSYQSVYCDNEQTESAKKLCKYKFIKRQLVEHRHPVWKKTEWDSLYERNENRQQYTRDQENYLSRLENNFYL